MSQAILQVRDISLSFKGVKAINALSFDVARGEICALIGPNGAGKSSLLKNTAWLSLLKLRGSYGVLGNLGSLTATSVSPLLTKSQIYMGSTPTLLNGYYENTLANPSLTWASSKQTDVGVDAAVLDSRLTLSADYFVKKTDNMIIYKALTSTTGISVWQG